MFNFNKKINNKISLKKKETIEIKNLKSEVNLFNNYIIYKSSNILKVYDRNCNHAGGRIISKNNEHKCPLHNWKFDPKTGKYFNGIEKKECSYIIKNKKIIIKEKDLIPTITKSKKNSLIKIRFFNHAFLKVETENFKFATDPWAIGPAFNNGWFLKKKTKNDWIDELNSCDFIYISHNHPDHLHPLTLNEVRKDMLFLVPNFITKSAEIYLRSLGFNNIFMADFLKEYNFKKTNLNLSILKSGDFREDSGIYFSIGEFTCLFSVDSNNINHGRLPKVDLYASSFAGGASGFPLVFDNFTKKEKKKITINNQNLFRIKKRNEIVKIKPKYFLPYAGFFKENIKRDQNIYYANKKYKIKDYEKLTNDINCKLLNVDDYDQFFFKDKKLVKKNNIKNKFYNDLKEEFYIHKMKFFFHKIDKKYIKKYFVDSNFKDNLILIVSLTNDTFKKVEIEFKVNFSNDNIVTNFCKGSDLDKLKLEKNKRYLHIKCRKEVFLNVIHNKQPWEDLVIGFQCNIYRKPNEYNANFWHHFSNKYITNKNVRMSSECYKCPSLFQNLSNQLKVIN